MGVAYLSRKPPRRGGATAYYASREPPRWDGRGRGDARGGSRGGVGKTSTAWVAAGPVFFFCGVFFYWRPLGGSQVLWRVLAPLGCALAGSQRLGGGTGEPMTLSAC